MTQGSGATAVQHRYAASLGEDRSRLEAWLLTITGWPVASAFQTDGDRTAGNQGAGHQFVLAVTGIAQVADFRPDRDLPVRINITYVMAPGSPDPSEAHDCLVRLLAGVPDQSLFTVVADPLPPTWWLAMGVRPRPHVLVQTTIVQSRTPANRGPLVTQPLTVEVAETKSVSGIITDEHGVALTGAVLQLVGTGYRTTSDNRGRFTFARMAADRTADLTVRTRGVNYTATIPAQAQGELLITCMVAEREENHA